MDLNYLFTRHQISLVRAAEATCAASRSAHRGLVRGYAGLIDALQQRTGASFPLYVAGVGGGKHR